MDIESPEERLLTPKEVAWFLRVERKTVLSMLKDGRLKGFKVGGQWRIRVRDLKEFMGV